MARKRGRPTLDSAELIWEIDQVQKRWPKQPLAATIRTLLLSHALASQRTAKAVDRLYRRYRREKAAGLIPTLRPMPAQYLERLESLIQEREEEPKRVLSLFRDACGSAVALGLDPYQGRQALLKLHLSLSSQAEEARQISFRDPDDLVKYAKPKDLAEAVEAWQEATGKRDFYATRAEAIRRLLRIHALADETGVRLPPKEPPPAPEEMAPAAGKIAAQGRKKSKGNRKKSRSGPG